MRTNEKKQEICFIIKNYATFTKQLMKNSVQGINICKRYC
jgi:tRNA U34 2-thiouridine synthase MnmA/TrmU